MKFRAVIKAKVKAAFTTTEALFGVAIMGTVFVSLYTGMAAGFTSIRDSQENLRATQILIEKFETLRLYNWDQLNKPGFMPETFTTTFAPTESSKGVTYNGRVIINQPTTMGELYNTDLRLVTIHLNWVSKGITHNRSFVSYVAKYGIQNYVY